jgi:hypothetical protein
MCEPGNSRRLAIGDGLARADNLGIRTCNPSYLGGGMPGNNTEFGILVYGDCVHINGGSSGGIAAGCVMGTGVGGLGGVCRVARR